jgi:hypothetical protein
MKANVPLQIRRGTSTATDERVAVAEIRQRIHQDAPRLILFFCSPTYDLAKLAGELQTAFGETPVVGCTTAGQVGMDGYTTAGLSALSLAGEITAQPFLVELASMDQVVHRIAAAASALRQTQPDRHSFGLLLVDGLSRMEERLISLLYRQLPQVPVVGGSAGDDLMFKQTLVYAEGRFHPHAAVFTLFNTARSFRTFKFDHFVPTEHTLVVTSSDPDQRVVREINGEPAAQVYADLVGVPVERLNAPVFSQYPFLLEMGGEHYLRSIYSVNPDRSLTLLCAIEDGVILSLGRTVDPVAAARDAFRQVREEIGEPALVIGCDCILRRLEFESSGLLDTIGAILRRNQVFGFSTYGEQYDGLHMNQTFTGIAIANDDATA